MTLVQTAAKCSAGVLDQMRLDAEVMAYIAKKMAPVDRCNLEGAIKTDESAGGRNDLGQFARKEISVFIDTTMPVPSRPGKTVGNYAYEMHEHLEPVGPLHLGPKSVEKQLSQAEIVGGGFLSRAADEYSQTMVDNAIAVVNETLA